MIDEQPNSLDLTFRTARVARVDGSVCGNENRAPQGTKLQACLRINRDLIALALLGMTSPVGTGGEHLEALSADVPWSCGCFAFGPSGQRRVDRVERNFRGLEKARHHVPET